MLALGVGGDIAVFFFAAQGNRPDFLHTLETLGREGMGWGGGSGGRGGEDPRMKVGVG